MKTALKRIYIPLIAVFIACFLTLFLISNESLNLNTIKGVCCFWTPIILLQYILFVVTYYLKNNSINNPFIYFISGALICWFGQFVVVSFSLDTAYTPVVFNFDPSALFETAKYSALSLCALMLAGLLFSRENKANYHHMQINDHNLKFSMTTTGVILSILGAYSYLIPRLDKAVTTATSGYADNFIQSDASSIENIFANFSMFFLPGLLLTTIANKENSRLRPVMATLFLGLVILSLATGGRSEAILLILTLLWLYTNEIRKLRFTQVIIIILSGYVFVRISNALAEFRIMKGDLSDLGSLLISGNSNGGSAIGNILNEFGFNIFSLYHTTNLIPASQDFANGYTYFASFMAIVPSFFFGGFSFSDAAGLPQWLKDTLGLDYGPGYSIAAESYYNFGWFGILPIFILGFILVKLFTNASNDLDMRSLRNVFIAILIYSTIFIARDTSLMIFRKYFYMVLIPLVIIYITYQYRVRFRRIENA